MKITNKTHWQTAHLRAFLSRIAAEELSASQRARLRFTFQYTRKTGSRYSSGYACGGRIAQVNLSKHTPCKLDLARVIAHELAHVRGMSHRTMKGDPRYDRDAQGKLQPGEIMCPRAREIYAWAEALPLEVKPPKASAFPSIDWKLEHVQTALARNLTKLKRLTTIVKKWRAKERYYLRKVAAAKPPKDT